jgi:hypothetical protein
MIAVGYILLLAVLLIAVYTLIAQLRQWIRPRQNGQRLALYIGMMVLLMAICAVAGGWLAMRLLLTMK